MSYFYKIYNKIASHNNNLLVVGFVTFFFGKIFHKKIYSINAVKNPWHPDDSGFTLSFDCDYPEDVEAIPQILNLMKSRSFKASFACVGYWIKKYPDIHKMILDHGHEIINHTYSHPDNELLNPGRKFREISYAEKKEEVEYCHEIAWKNLRYEMKGCRIPHFKHLFTPEIYRILYELGYSFSSSTWLTNTISCGYPFEASYGIIEFPLATCPLHPFTVFDTWHSLNSPRWSHKVLHRGSASYCKLFRNLVDVGMSTHSYINIYIDPLDITKIPDFEDLLIYLDENPIKVVSYDELLTEYDNAIKEKNT